MERESKDVFRFGLTPHESPRIETDGCEYSTTVCASDVFTEIGSRLNYIAICSLMIRKTSGASGLIRVPKRATTLPSLPTTNFSKFQLMSL